MKSKCGKCRCAVGDGASLCHACGRALVAQLATVPGLIADLTVMRSRQERLHTLTPRIHSTTTPRVPVQLAARQGSAPTLRGDAELARLGNAVMVAAGRIGKALGGQRVPFDSPGLAQLVINNRHDQARPLHLVDPVHRYASDGHLVAVRQPRRYPDGLDPTPATDIEMAAIWCACHPVELRTDPDAAATFRVITGAIWAVQAVIDPQRPRYLGPCPHETGGIDDTGIARTCGYRLVVNPDRRTLRCARCHTRYVVADLEAAALRRAEDGLWTLVDLLEHVLPSIGQHIPRSTLYRWARRHVIIPRGYASAVGRRITERRHHHTDSEVYRLGDVLAALTRDANRHRAAEDQAGIRRDRS